MMTLMMVLAVVGMVVAMVVVAFAEEQAKKVDAVENYVSKVSEVEAILAQLDARVK